MPPEQAAAPDSLPEHTYQLSHTGDPAYANEIVTLMRNMLDKSSSVRIDNEGQDLVVSANPEQTRLAEALLNDVDSVRPPQTEQKVSDIFSTTKTLPSRDDPYAARQIEQTYYIRGVADPAAFLKKLRAVAPSSLRFFWVASEEALVTEGSADDHDRIKEAIKTLRPSWSAVEAGGASAAFVVPVQVSDSVLQVRAFYLPESPAKNHDAEILIALRNTVNPSAKVYMVQSQHAIVVMATAEQMKLAQKVVDDLDVKAPALQVIARPSLAWTAGR